MLKQIINREGGEQPAKPAAPAAPAPAQEAAPAPAQPAAAPAAAASPAPAASPSPAPMASGAKNILSSDVEIVGNVKFGDSLVVDGVVNGEIHSGGVLTVGENARITGEIKTGSVSVFGKVKGNITAGERCELKPTSEVEGDIAAKRLAMEEGASFSGRSKIGGAA